MFKVPTALRWAMFNIRQSFDATQSNFFRRASSINAMPTEPNPDVPPMDERGLRPGETNLLEAPTLLQDRQQNPKVRIPDPVQIKMVHLALPEDAQSVVLNNVVFHKDDMIHRSAKNGLSEYFSFEAEGTIYVLWTKEKQQAAKDHPNLPVLSDEVVIAPSPKVSFDTAMQAFRARTAELRSGQVARQGMVAANEEARNDRIAAYKQDDLFRKMNRTLG